MYRKDDYPSYLFKVGKGAGLTTHDGAEATQRCALQLLAAVQGIAILEKPHVILADTLIKKAP